MYRTATYPNRVTVPSSIPLYSVQSSMIDEIGYDEPSQTVAVRFLSGDLYRVYPVAPATFAAFKCDSSKGRYYNDVFRDAPEYTIVKVVRQATVPPTPAPAPDDDINDLFMRVGNSAAKLREAQAVYDNLRKAIVERLQE